MAGAPGTIQRVVALVNAGGTIGMRENEDGRLEPVAPDKLVSLIGAMPGFSLENGQHVLRLPSPGHRGERGLDVQVRAVAAFDEPPDSSAMTPVKWAAVAEAIVGVLAQQDVDGVVVLHGTDTMAWTASAMSFVLGSLQHPVVFTGAQLPLVYSRTDGLRNLVTAIEFACDKETPNEVALLFDQVLLRGNRTTKATVSHLGAFDSPNFPPLAHAGTVLQPTPPTRPPRPLDPIDIEQWKKGLATARVLVHRVYPGCREFPQLPSADTRVGVILEAFGTGTANPEDGLREWIDALLEMGAVVVLRSQVPHGSIDPGLYEASEWLSDRGVIPGADITSEACAAKLFYLLGREDLGSDEVERKMRESLRGEVSFPDPVVQGKEVGRYPQEVYTLALRDQIGRFFTDVEAFSFAGPDSGFDIVFRRPTPALRVGVEVKFGHLHAARVRDVLSRFGRAVPVDLIVVLSDGISPRVEQQLKGHEPEVIWMSRSEALGKDWATFLNGYG